MGTTDSACRRWISTMMDGRIFTWRATARRAFSTTTIATEHSRMLQWSPVPRLTKTGKNRREWAQPLATITATAAWTYSRIIFQTIPRHFIVITDTETLITERTQRDPPCTQN